MNPFFKHLISYIILALISLTLFLSANVSTSIAQTPTPTTNLPTPTIDPTITALQNVVATQEVEIQTLRRDLNYEVRDIRWWFLVAGVLAAITGLTGYQAYRGIDEQVRKKIRVMTNKYYYQLDVTNLDVNIRKGQHQDKLIELLKSQGLYNISRFERLGSGSFRGITIFSIENDSDEKDFVRYIEQYFVQSKRVNPKRAGFILYAPTGYRIRPETIDMYPATAVANTPWNLVSTLMVLGRHITAPPKIEEDDEDEKD